MEQITSLFRYILDDKDKSEKITEKKPVSQVVKILVLMLMKGKFDSQHPNMDITKNPEILNYSLQIFDISIKDNNQNVLNDIIKVIGLFAKFSVYFANGIDVAFCHGFLKSVKELLLKDSNKTPNNIQINILKAIGIMISAASMMTKRSLVFYKSLQDFDIINIIFRIIKNFKNVKKTNNFRIITFL